MRVDEAGRDRPATRVDDAEALLVQAKAADPLHDLGQRPDGQDPALPGGHGRRVTTLGIRGTVAVDGGHVVLSGTGPQPARQRRHLRRTADEQAGRWYLGAAGQDPQGHPPTVDCAAARRSSRAMVGSKSRMESASAAASRRFSIGPRGATPTWSATSIRAASRRQADELRLAQLDALVGGQVADRLPEQPERRDRVVEQVHRDLRPLDVVQVEPQRLDPRQSAGSLADAVGDALGEVDVARLEVDVEGDQERSSADGHGAGGGMHAGRAEVGLTPEMRDIRLEALVLWLADVSQDDPLGPACAALA